MKKCIIILSVLEKISFVIDVNDIMICLYKTKEFCSKIHLFSTIIKKRIGDEVANYFLNKDCRRINYLSTVNTVGNFTKRCKTQNTTFIYCDNRPLSFTRPPQRNTPPKY